MKVKVTNNRHFNLSVEDTEFLINCYIKPSFPDHNFFIKKSRTTNSVYIYVHYEGEHKLIRLSDHPNAKSIYHYISPHTKISKVVSIISNAIRSMQNKHLDTILNEI